jgi:putative ABC transport system ATP-binding protein
MQGRAGRKYESGPAGSGLPADTAACARPARVGRVDASIDSLVRLEGVTKRYDNGEPAVAGVSLAVAPGEAVAIMGPSGSGKSTLLNLIAAIDRPTSGAVWVGAERVDALSETAAARFRRRQVGMVFQFFNLLEDMTVIDNVLLPAQLARTGSGARRRAEELLEKLRIAHRRDAYPGRLSGGERQRVAIARALINKPALLLADEPTGAVDTAAGEEISALLRELNAAGQTLILVTHNPDLAARYTRRTIAIADGRVAPDSGPAPGTAASLASSAWPASPEGARR